MNGDRIGTFEALGRRGTGDGTGVAHDSVHDVVDTVRDTLHDDGLLVRSAVHCELKFLCFSGFFLGC
jgi:hypothetical protein